MRARVCLTAASIALLLSACETRSLDLRDPSSPDVPQPSRPACELAGRRCIAPDPSNPTSVCPDNSEPFSEECNAYNTPFGQALCCSPVELSECELAGNSCFDDAFLSCPPAHELVVGPSCKVPGRPVNQLCCRPIPCEQAQYFCYFDPFMPNTCPEGFVVEPLACADQDGGVPVTCCSGRM